MLENDVKEIKMCIKCGENQAASLENDKGEVLRILDMCENCMMDTGYVHFALNIEDGSVTNILSNKNVMLRIDDE